MLDFKCKVCGGGNLKEIMTSCSVVSMVRSIDEKDGYLGYENSYNDANDENEIYYACAGCNNILEGICDEEDLIEYIQENQ